MIDTVSAYAPELVAAHGSLAKASELRYLAQRSLLVCRDGRSGTAFMLGALRSDPRILIKQPVLATLALIAAPLSSLLPAFLYRRIEAVGMKLVGAMQRLTLPDSQQSGSGACKPQPNRLLGTKPF